MSYGILNGTEMIAKFIAPLTVKSNQPVFSSDTLSLSRVSVKRNVQRWEIDANLEPLVGTANDLFAHLVTKGSSESFKIKMPQNYGAQLQIEKPLEITATLNKENGNVFTVVTPSNFNYVSVLNKSIIGVGIITSTDAVAKTLTVTTLIPGNPGHSKPKSYFIDSETELTVGAALAGVTSLPIVSNTNKKLPVGLFITFGIDPKVYMVVSHTTSLVIFPELRLPITTTTAVKYTEVEMNAKYDTDVISGMVYSDGIMMTTGQVKLIEAL
jgi:hypothetical protein